MILATVCLLLGPTLASSLPWNLQTSKLFRTLQPYSDEYVEDIGSYEVYEQDSLSPSKLERDILADIGIHKVPMLSKVYKNPPSDKNTVP